MRTLSYSRYQCRTFDTTYVFKVKNSEEKLSLKILDISQKCLFKKTFLPQDLSLSGVGQLLAKGGFPTVLKSLVKRDLLPKEHLIPRPRKVTRETCEKELEQTIEKFKRKIFIERKEMEGFTCPITLEVFKEPVVDEHGHTFEKSAIEEVLKIKNECPISRQPIFFLTSNRIVQQTIEEWQQGEPIPNFSLFQKENSKLADINLQMAQTYAEEGEYEEALKSYEKAFQYTRNCSDYIGLPALFEGMKETEKGALAYLYLSHYQLQDGKLAEAIQTLESCQLDPHQGEATRLAIDLLLVKFYDLSNQPEKAMKLGIQSAEVLSEQNPEQAITLYKQLLTQYPERFDLYFCLAQLLKSSQERAQVLLKGACHALKARDYETASRLCQEANTCSQDSFFDQLVHLDLLSKQEKFPEIEQELVSLAKVFEEKGLTKQMLQTYKMLFQIEKRPEYCKKIRIAYKKLKKPHKRAEWSAFYLSLLIDAKKWLQAEKIAQKALKKANEPQKVFLYKSLEKVYTHWHGHELQNLWPKLGKAYRESKQLAAAEKNLSTSF